MERNIPDVRDIFGRQANDSSHRKQELRSYDYSPRSRRRYEAMEDYDYRAPTSHHEPRPNVTGGNKKSNRHRQSMPDDFSEPVRQGNKKSSDDNQKAGNPRNKDSAYYANRTLTERDIRHLERHLSMKKTIRKQISRNLAQAFVDDPELIMTAEPAPPPAKSGSNKVSNDRSFTLTRAKVSKSEQNVLDLLKDNEPDSGHCSADNPNSSDDDSQEQTRQRHNGKSEKASCNSRPVVEIRNKPDQPYKEDGKFSFWKMFSVKNRGKR